MRKFYTAPEFESVMFEVEDVICASGNASDAPITEEEEL